jgi:hypothetical protein
MGNLLSIPTYPMRHRGEPLIIVGGAETALQELSIARKIYGDDTAVMAVKYMPAFVLATHCFTLHPEAIPKIIELSAAAHAGHVPIIHTTLAGGQEDQFAKLADFVWPNVRKGGTSAFGAALVAKEIGFGPIILCGCHIDKTGYVPGYSHSKRTFAADRTGENATIHSWREAWQMAKDNGQLEDVFSLGGYTQKVLGWPTTLIS